MKILIRILLFPFSLIYFVAISVWDVYWRLAPKVKLPCKVISVGNIVAGGAGKTPLVIYIARMFINAGYKIAVVARGYKRQGEGLVEVDDESSWESVGDEPLEIFRAVADARVYVGKSKTEAAQKSAANGAQVIIIDDGFQHRKLARDIDLVCLDSNQPFGQGWLLPSGRLREPRYALSRADALIFTSYEKNNDTLNEVIDRKKYKSFYSSSNIAKFIKLNENSAINPENIRLQKSIAFCGLGNPDKFKSALENLGIRPRIFHTFSDHHRYSHFDIEMLIAMVKHENVDCLITTRKDAVKFDSVAFGDLPVYYAMMDITIGGENEFRKLLGL